MDEIQHLNELIETLSAGALGVGGSLFAVVVFGLYTFIRIMNRSINQNLEMVENVQQFASKQESKRHDTQTALDDIGKQLLATSVALERQKTRADALEEMVNGYKSQCSKTIEVVMSQVNAHSEREKKLQSQIDSLMEQTRALATQNRDLMQLVTTLQSENSTLKTERAKFEIQTARNMARMEARLQMLDQMDKEAKQNHAKPTSSTKIETTVDSNNNGGGERSNSTDTGTGNDTG